MTRATTLKQHVEAALTEAGLPLAQGEADGYRVSASADARVRVHWSPGRRLPWPSGRLAVANIRLAERGFCCQAEERRDADGFYVRVDGSASLAHRDRH